MPQSLKIVKDTTTGLFLYYLGGDFDHCVWVNESQATKYNESVAIAICDALNDELNETNRFVGQNPPLH